MKSFEGPGKSRVPLLSKKMKAVELKLYGILVRSHEDTLKGLDDDLGAAKQRLAEIELDDRESRDSVARSIKHIKSLKEVALDKLFVSRIIHALKLKENGENSLAGTALLCAIEGLRAGHPLRKKIKSEDPNFREVLSKDPSNLPKLPKKKPTK